MDVRTKRVYEDPDPGDGVRVLVDRVWPRGLTKAQVRADLWLKDIAPSTALRRWFGHEPEKWEAFVARYFEELDAQPTAMARLEDEVENGPVTLLYAARDTEHNQAVALQAYLRSRAK